MVCSIASLCKQKSMLISAGNSWRKYLKSVVLSRLIAPMLKITIACYNVILNVNPIRWGRVPLNNLQFSQFTVFEKRNSPRDK